MSDPESPRGMETPGAAVRHLRYVDFHDIDEFKKDGWLVVPTGTGPNHPVLDTRGVLMVRWGDDGDSD